MGTKRLCCVVLALAAAPWALAAEKDWPMWRYDAGRTASSPHELPADLSLRWVREELPLSPAWPDEPRLHFDAAYEPVVLGKTLFYASPRTDCLLAVSTETGEEQWRFYADGPIRFAPVAASGKVYFASDDGCLYCLGADDGTLRWRVRGAPGERSVLGNGRLVSTWPARGAPVLYDGVVYFAASIWPFMGVYIHAVDAESGAPVWINDGSGSNWTVQPHSSPAFAGVAPQGYLAACETMVLVPNGRSQPAGFDRRTGELRYLHMNSKSAGGHRVSIGGDVFFGSRERHDLVTGAARLPVGPNPVVTQHAVYTCDSRGLRAESLATRRVDGVNRDGQNVKIEKPVESVDLKLPAASWQLYLKAGNRLYLGQPSQVLVVDAPPSGEMKIAAQHEVVGEPASMIAADDKLFVAMREGQLQCFAAAANKRPVSIRVRTAAGTAASSLSPAASSLPPAASSLPAAASSTDEGLTATKLLDETKVAGGYCLVLGLNDGRLVEQLVRQSALHVIGVDADAAKIDRLRRRFDALGLYGSRVALHAGDPLRRSFPPYLAELITSECSPTGRELIKAPAEAAQLVRQVFSALRPYGGTACLPLAGGQIAAAVEALRDNTFAGAKARSTARAIYITRDGPLPGAGTWTHQYADVANSVVSADTLVQAPLGLLWFGGPSHREVLPRHGHGPTPQVVGGRLFIEGPDTLRATDVYTGRVLWTASLPGVGKPYDNTQHQPGANAIGSNYASAADGVYVAHGDACLKLDPATGRRLRAFTLATDGDGKAVPWGYVGVYEDLLIGSGPPMSLEGKPPGGFTLDGAASRHLVVMNRHSGEVLWRREAAFGFRHNTVVAGAGKLFCIDMLPEAVLKRLKQWNETRPGKPRLLAFDIRTGETLWSSEANVFGTWLGYSVEHDVLLQGGRASRDMLKTEPNERMIAYVGSTGKTLWDAPNGYSGPCMLHGKRIITQGTAFDLQSGQPLMRSHPITGEPQPWGFSRNYGCNTAIGSQRLLTFRSAAAGYFDLPGDGGTGNIGGFRAGCTSNLIAADGVLNAPDYTRTCTCDYQNQTSLALVHMPDAEMWTFSNIKPSDGPVRRVGINFGAPGDRRAADGTLWLDYPSVGGPSPDIRVAIEPEGVRWFRRHASNVAGPGLNWAAASGVEGVSQIALSLAKNATTDRAYTVRLHFAEPHERARRTPFSVSLQGETVLKGLDVAAAAGGPLRSLVKEFRGVRVHDKLVVDFAGPNDASSSGGPLLCGIEVLEE